MERWLPGRGGLGDRHIWIVSRRKEHCRGESGWTVPGPGQLWALVVMALLH